MNLFKTYIKKIYKLISWYLIEIFNYIYNENGYSYIKYDIWQQCDENIMENRTKSCCATGVVKLLFIVKNLIDFCIKESLKIRMCLFIL